MWTNSKRGTGLIEVMIVSALVGVILTGVYMIWSSMAKSWVSETVKINLNQELQVAINQIKKEMRLSSGTEVFYYPTGSPPYSAVSMPIAKDEDNDSLIEIDVNENIVWSDTVIYHSYLQNGNLQLRKTIYSPRDNSLTSVERMEQLSYVVTNGVGTGTYNGGNATTKTLFSFLDSFEITPALVTFDGYSAVLERSKYIKFGSIVLTPGTHTLKFEVTEKNALSSDYHFAIDSLLFSPSGGERETEEMPLVGTSGQTNEIEDLSSIGSWSGHAHLLYHGGAPSHYVELEMYHDEWIETNFDEPSAAQEDILFEFDSSLSPPEIILRLDGMDVTWEAETQTQGGISVGYAASPPELPSLQDLTVRVLISGSILQKQGAMARVLFRAHPTTNNFHVRKAYIVERSSVQDGVSATQQQLFFSNATVPIGTEQIMTNGAVGGGSDSINIPPGREVYSNWVVFPIDKEKDYFVTFLVDGGTGNFSASYTPAPAGVVNSYYRTGDHASSSVWSGAGTNFAHVIGVMDLQVTHPTTGTWTSQIYDTKLSDPNYSQLSWTYSEPAGTDITVSMRSSDFSDMSDNPSWISFTSTPAVIGSEVGRYAQIKVDMTTSTPYFETPKVKQVSLRWPGDETVVDIGGYFSKSPDYGIIKLTVDGQELSKSVSVDLKVKETYQQKEYSSTINAEIEPRNTPQ